VLGIRACDSCVSDLSPISLTYGHEILAHLHLRHLLMAHLIHPKSTSHTYTHPSQFSRYITTPSTTTATSTTTSAPADLDPPVFAPPPPPAPAPLNIPPSRARRQLAARLARHTQTAHEPANDTNGESASSAPPEKSSSQSRNPFADTDSDDELESESDGAWALRRGGPGPGPDPEPEAAEGFEDLDDDDDDHVGVPLRDLPAVSSYLRSFPSLSPPEGWKGTISDGGEAVDEGVAAPRPVSPVRGGFAGLWPFGQGARGQREEGSEGRGRDGEGGEEMGNVADFFGQSDSDSSDEGFDGVGEREASGEFKGERGRRPSVTTEATRRTSLDDEDEVVVGEVEGKKAEVPGGQDKGL